MVRSQTPPLFSEIQQNREQQLLTPIRVVCPKDDLIRASLFFEDIFRPSHFRLERKWKCLVALWIRYFVVACVIDSADEIKDILIRGALKTLEREGKEVTLDAVKRIAERKARQIVVFIQQVY